MLSSLDEQRTEDLVVGFPYFEHAAPLDPRIDAPSHTHSADEVRERRWPRVMRCRFLRLTGGCPVAQMGAFWLAGTLIPADRRVVACCPAGTGLATCRCIVAAHGGVIGITDGIDGGAAVWFRLRRADPHSGARSAVRAVSAHIAGLPAPRSGWTAREVGGRPGLVRGRIRPSPGSIGASQRM